MKDKKQRTSKQNQMNQTAEQIKTGEHIVSTIKRVGINGEGVGYYKRKAVFIEGALPEEVVKAKVTRVEATYLLATIVKIEKKSPFRQKPPCPVYSSCGGCQLLHMQYNGQLKAKEMMVREAFSRYTKREDIPLRPIVGMDNPWSYRHKAQLQVGSKGNQVLTGLYSPGSHQIVDIANCPIQHDEINQVMKVAKRVIGKYQISIYQDKSKKGILRTIVARVSSQSKEIQLTFIVTTKDLPYQNEIITEIRRNLPTVISISMNVNDKDTSLIFGDETILLWGNERLDVSLEDIEFSLSPRAFFQLNPEQAIRLFDFTKEAAALSGEETVVDAYCGTGTIALWLAKDAKEIRGIESIPEAVEDATRNADRNGIKNVQFFVGKADQLLTEWMKKQKFQPDIIVADPPRTGLDAKLLQAILHSQPQRMVYVSCNPSTLAKDCKVLFQAGYEMEWIQPVDMFPQTAHVECCSLLVKKDK